MTQKRVIGFVNKAQLFVHTMSIEIRSPCTSPVSHLNSGYSGTTMLFFMFTWHLDPQKTFKNCQLYFFYFPIVSPWKWAWSYTRTVVNSDIQEHLPNLAQWFYRDDEGLRVHNYQRRQHTTDMFWTVSEVLKAGLNN